MKPRSRSIETASIPEFLREEVVKPGEIGVEGQTMPMKSVRMPAELVSSTHMDAPSVAPRALGDVKHVPHDTGWTSDSHASASRVHY
jgi:hypothetical protein